MPDKEMNSKKYFRLREHGNLNKIFDNIYTINGSMRLFGVFRYSRSMTILKDGDDLALVNPVRVDQKVLKSIEELGDVKHVFKIGRMHSLDVPFYMDHYRPKLWVTKGDTYLKDYKPDFYFDDMPEMPFLNIKAQVVHGSKHPETFLITPQNGGCLHSCDAFVNLGVDTMANWLTASLSKLLPSPTYVGPNWIKIARPPRESMLKVLDYEFDKFVPAHGEAIGENAKEKLRTYLNKYYS